jgi:F0F1-type ATP synthase epsilon subunit
MVLVPATTGDFGILPGHVPTVSQLRPGVVSVHVNDKDVKKVRFVAQAAETNPSGYGGL